MTTPRIVTPSRMRWRLVVASADGWRSVITTHNRAVVEEAITADARLAVESVEPIDHRAHDSAHNEGGETT